MTHQQLTNKTFKLMIKKTPSKSHTQPVNLNFSYKKKKKKTSQPQ